jgi:hypothetical protein
MKKPLVLLLDWVLRHLICFRTTFGFYALYKMEIHNTYIEPITKLIRDPYGEYHYEVIWRNPPKWYKKWMYKIENRLAQIIYNYLLKNKEYLAK